MVGYTSEGASGAQWFAAEPPEVWAVTKRYFASKRLRGCDDVAMRIDVNLGMSAFTGNVIASVSVQPAPQGGSVLQFSARMGTFSRGQVGAQRRIEDERGKLISAVARLLPPPAARPPTEPPPAQTGLAGQLAQLTELHASGALSDDEFAAAKARLLD
jgi:hypothetical protein